MREASSLYLSISRFFPLSATRQFMTVSSAEQGVAQGQLVSLSRTWAASCRPIPLRVLTRLATAVLSLFLASHRLRMASVGLGWVPKKVLYLLTPSLSASILQSLLVLLGWSRSSARLCLTARGILKGGAPSAGEAREEQPEEEAAWLGLAKQLSSDMLETRAKAASLSVTSWHMLEST